MLNLDEITKRRAYGVFELTKERLLEGDEDESCSEAYRFSYLVLRGPKKFLNAFGAGNLFLDLDAISSTYFMLRFDLVGPKGLTAEEEHVIYIHNEEVGKFLSG